MALILLSVFAASAHAKPGPKPQRPSMAKGPMVKSTAPKSGGPAVRPMKAGKPVKSAAAGSPTKTTAAKHTGSKKTATTTSVDTKRHGSSSTTTAPGDAGTWTPSNPVAQKLSSKPNLLNKVTSSLPPNTDLNAATAGFKNFGQFVAAVNVSNNLGIAFTDLKSAMTGTTLDGTPTGAPTLSLGQAIHQLKPGVSAETEAHKAQTLADRDIVSSPAPAPTTTTTTSTTTTRTSARNTGQGGRTR